VRRLINLPTPVATALLLVLLLREALAARDDQVCRRFGAPSGRCAALGTVTHILHPLIGVRDFVQIDAREPLQRLLGLFKLPLAGPAAAPVTERR